MTQMTWVGGTDRNGMVCQRTHSGNSTPIPICNALFNLLASLLWAFNCISRNPLTWTGDKN